MRFVIAIAVDTTRTVADRIVTDLRAAAVARLPAGSFVHVTIDTRTTSEQVGSEVV